MKFTEEELDFVWGKWSTMTAREIGRRLKISKNTLKQAYQLLGLPACPKYRKTTWVQPELRPVVIQSDQAKRQYGESMAGVTEDDLKWQYYWSLPKYQRSKLAPPH